MKSTISHSYVIQLNIFGLVLFDIDGVIRDVSNSYRLASKKTVLKFCGWEPTSTDIDNLKNEGIWNNDWDLSLELIKRFIHKNNLLVPLPTKADIIRYFEQLYFGCSPQENYSKWNGFICNEEILIDTNIFNLFNTDKIGWGFVSGAEKPSARFILEKRLNLNKPPLVAMGDAPDKPNPDGLIRLSKMLLKNELGSNTPPIVYVGDTIADVKTVINARKQIPNQSFISIALAPPHLYSINYKREREKYEMHLKNAGADIILNSINDIQDLYRDIFFNQ